MRITPLLGAAATLCAPPALAQSGGGSELRPPAAFATIGDPATRSRALFAEAAKVLTSPRCINCHLAMAWQGKSVGDICRQLEDRNRNGGRTLAMVQEHVANDDLVAYGWTPGKGRAPAPGTQALAGELVQAWIDTGAECP